jgi:hypothetical protein
MKAIQSYEISKTHYLSHAVLHPHLFLDDLIYYLHRLLKFKVKNLDEKFYEKVWGNSILTVFNNFLLYQSIKKII